ncbi:hypothetical protein HGRIS_014023 [Hohenbuehelia grisea]|uniref:Endosomal/vacuolar adapter protein YPT35 n=1 Tax=Hohenbuehelia grisea TaxID=104357 RepID=A0ABR3JU95_9AGAR
MSTFASSSAAPIEHPFAHTTSLIEVIPDTIDIEEEARLYEELCYDEARPRYESSAVRPVSRPRSPSSRQSASIFSKEIWMDDKSGSSLAFAQDVEIAGWTNVGDKLGGAYVVYDCLIKTKEGTAIHVHKRYSAFAQLESALRRTLPPSLRPSIPPLPPKAPLAKYRAAFLERRRRLLQYWLASVLLHPDIGACQAVRLWVMD